MYAPPNPLRGLTTDAEYLATFLSTIEGPIVLVGHSYGGAVITQAATGNENVRALVYVAAYALAEGENVAAANELGGGHSDLLNHIVVRPYPGAPEGDGDVYVDPAAFRSIFAQDLPPVPDRRDGSRPAPGHVRRPGHAVRGAGLEDHPVVVPPRWRRPAHPAGRPGRDGGACGRLDPYDPQLPRRDDEPSRRATASIILRAVRSTG